MKSYRDPPNRCPLMLSKVMSSPPSIRIEKALICPRLDLAMLKVVINPCCVQRSWLTASDGSERKIRVLCSVMAFCGLRDGLLVLLY